MLSCFLKKKNRIISTLSSFKRDVILDIIKVYASWEFDVALQVGESYLIHVINSNAFAKNKFIDVGYFLLFPTIFDDHSADFVPINDIDHNSRTRLRTVLNNQKELKTELQCYQTVLATLANDQEGTSESIFEVLKTRETFISLFLLHTYLNVCLRLCKWSNCIVTASVLAKDTDGFQTKTFLWNWLDDEILPRFTEWLAPVMMLKKFEVALYVNAIAELVVISQFSQELPTSFESNLVSVIQLIHDSSLKPILTNPETQKGLNFTPADLVQAIKIAIEKLTTQLKIRGNHTRKVVSITSLINSVSSAT